MDQVMLIDAQDDRQNVVLGLREAGFGVREEIDSESAVRQVKEDPHQIIVVDEAMPGTSSKELLIALREITESPIVIIGEGGETAMVEALMKGADLYLERPIVVPELAARLRALGRRYDQEVGLNGYLRTLDDSGQLAKIFEKLSQTEARLLQYLLERAGKLTAREDLMASVWGENGKETSLRFYICQLRRKLSGAERIEIMNMKGIGYLLKVHQPI